MVIWHRILLILCAFVGIGALAGSALALIAPDGSLMAAQELIPILQGLPLVGKYVDSLFLPGCALLLFVCIPQMLAALLLLRKHPKQYAIGLIGGLLLSVFTVVELVIMPSFLSWVYLLFGVIEIVSSLVCSLSAQRTGS